MNTMKHLLLMLVALTVALTAAPAFADPERHEEFRDGHRAERFEREHHEGERQEREREYHYRREHRDFTFVYPAPFVAPACSTQPGYWEWNGWRNVWVPPQTVCD